MRRANGSRAVALTFGWGVGGVILLFLEATLRLGLVAARTISAGLSSREWTGLVILSIVFTWFEGYLVFHRRIVPEVIERAGALAEGLPSRRDLLLAPLHALALTGAAPARARRAWLAVLLVCAAIGIVRHLPDPWRGIVDAAVAMALGTGLGSFAWRLTARIQAARVARRGAAAASPLREVC